MKPIKMRTNATKTNSKVEKNKQDERTYGVNAPCESTNVWTKRVGRQTPCELRPILKREKAIPDKTKYGQLTDESRTKRNNKTR